MLNYFLNSVSPNGIIYSLYSSLKTTILNFPSFIPILIHFKLNKLHTYKTVKTTSAGLSAKSNPKLNDLTWQVAWISSINPTKKTGNDLKETG